MRYTLFAALLLAASGALAQPANVSFNYPWTDQNPPLQCSCNRGTPYADGVGVYLVCDNNTNGPDSADVILGNWVINSTANGFPAGYFTAETPLGVDSVFVPRPCYVRINDGGCCWLTRMYSLAPGTQQTDILSTDWTCQDQACWQAQELSAPTNFRASDDSLCAHVAFTWEHDGVGNSGFQICRATDSMLVTRIAGNVRSYVMQVGSPEPQDYFVRATGGGQSGPSNADAGSPHLVHFADDSTGDIRGTQFGGAAFTLAMAEGAIQEDQCATTDSLILLANNGREAVLAVGHDVSEISGHFPNLALTDCRVLSVFYYEANGRGFVSTDTTTSTFVLVPNGAQPQTTPLPLRTELSQVYPNPFNPAATITFSVAREGMVKLVVFDVLGRQVRTLADGRFDAGEHKVPLDGAGLSSGIYFVRMETGARVHTAKVMLLK